MHPLHAVERELAANAASLRALAHDLVGRDAADDLVQETALRALRSPPRQPTGLGAWLATILRRLASSQRRSTRRRSQREQLAAASEALPAVDDAAVRRESLQSVTQALFALPEPYQRTVLLRYFEGLTPTAIAARTNQPLATVKSRLQRGLALLRDNLDHRDRGGDWRAGLVLATGLALPTGALTLAAGAVLMANTLKISLAAALIVGAVALWQFGGMPAAPPPAAAKTTGSDLLATDASAATLPRDATAGRTIVSAAPFPGVDLAHPYEFAMHLQVVDGFGLPLQGARITLQPMGCSDNTWEESTDDAGIATIHWHGRTDAQRVALRVGTGLLRALDVRAGGTTALVLVGEAGNSHRVVLGAAEVQVGDSPKNLWQRNDRTDAPETLRLSTRFLISSLAASDTGIAPTQGMHPERTFGDELIHAAAHREVPVLGDIPLLGRVFRAEDHTFTLTLPEYQPMADFVTSDPAAPPHGAIAGTVLGEDGKPCAGTPVIWGTQEDLPSDRATTGDDGTFRFDNVPLGPILLRAGGGPAGMARQQALVAANGTTPAMLLLRREQTIRGTAFGASKQPLASWWVEYEALDGSWADRTRVRDDGTFVLANLPGRAGRVWLHEEPNALAAATLPSVLPDSGAIAFDLARTPAAGVIRLSLPATARPEAADAEPRVRDAQVRVWQDELQFACTRTRNDDSTFSVSNLPAGYYRVEAGGEETGWCSLGTHYLDGKSLLDLGAQALPPPGVLRLVGGAPDLQIELYHRRPYGDVRARNDLASTREEIALPAGKWLLFWRRGDGLPQVREFELRSGAVTELDLKQG